MTNLWSMSISSTRKFAIIRVSDIEKQKKIYFRNNVVQNMGIGILTFWGIITLQKLVLSRNFFF